LRGPRPPSPRKERRAVGNLTFAAVSHCHSRQTYESYFSTHLCHATDKQRVYTLHSPMHCQRITIGLHQRLQLQFSSATRKSVRLYTLVSSSERPALCNSLRTASRPHPSSALRNHLRHASSSSTVAAAVATETRLAATRLKSLIYGSTLVFLLGFGVYYVTDTREAIHKWVVAPSLRWLYLDAERAHEAGTSMLEFLYDCGLNPRERGNEDGAGDLATEVGINPSHYLLFWHLCY